MNGGKNLNTQSIEKKSTKGETVQQVMIKSYFMLPHSQDTTLIIAKLTLPTFCEDQIAFIANIINEFTEYTIHNASQSDSSEDIGTYVTNGMKQLVELNEFYKQEGLNQYFVRFLVADKNLLNKKLNNTYQINNIMSQVLVMEGNSSNYSEVLYYGTIKLLEKAGLSNQIY